MVTQGSLFIQKMLELNILLKANTRMEIKLGWEDLWIECQLIHRISTKSLLTLDGLPSMDRAQEMSLEAGKLISQTLLDKELLTSMNS
jgi:hypothetical protein